MVGGIRFRLGIRSRGYGSGRRCRGGRVGGGWGASMGRAAAAVEFGLPYSFAHFFSPVHTRAAIETYRRGFTASQYRSEPEATVAVGVICAETEEEAELLASSVRLLQRRIRQGDRRPGASPEDG